MHPWPGNFPEKTYVCAHRHKGVMRDSGGWGWVRMDAGACMDTQQTQNKANRDTNDRAGHNFDKSVWGGGN